MGGGRDDDAGSVIEDAEALGAPPEVIARLRDATGAGPFLLWPCNASILEAFSLVATQWRRLPDGRPCGLDYAAVKAGLEMAGIEADRRLLEGLQICEQEVMANV